MQGACGGGEGAAGTRVAAGGEKVDWGIFVFVGTAGAVCAERGGRRSGQAGHSGGAAQIERVAGAAERGGGGDLRAAGGGTFGDGGERGGGAAGVGWVEGAGDGTGDSGDLLLHGADPVCHGV